jgi:putative PEP-CTERM system histidine kinase
MLSNVGLFSYLTASITYAVLTLLLVATVRGRPFGLILIVASALTMLWAAVVAAGTMMAYPPVALMQLTELLRDAAWIFFLLQMMSLRFDGKLMSLAGKRWLPLFVSVLAAILFILFALPAVLANYSLRLEVLWDIDFLVWIGIAILGLVLLEQIFRNAIGGERWSIKYLCFGLGGLFAFDLFMYAQALLFRQMDPQVWQARGLVNALAAPLIAIGIARNTDWKQQLQLSRQVVFHTATLLGAGVYLITMAVAGYFIKYLGGNWGGVLQISFLIFAGILLLALLFSGQIRAKTRVFLSKHFFSYKYDYREEWLKFTETLASIGENVPEGITGTMARLVDSPGGLLWGSRDGIYYRLLCNWQMPEPAESADMVKLANWLRESQWVIDVDELRRIPDLYGDLEPPQWLGQIEDAWLIVPLMFNDDLQGILLLEHSPLQKSINWEDRDLLKTAGRQAASHLAQYLANQALVEARQFDAFNRLSAYVVHDLKNILAQQSLLVSNAQKYKHKPEFVDDMITTVGNSVSRMTSLMEQMRSGVRGSGPRELSLSELLQETVRALNAQEPRPGLTLAAQDCIVLSDEERLQTVFGHLIQNAQEACDRTGQVDVSLREESGTAVVEIKDNGKGMDQDFIRHRLFKPFDSTKGLTGMGIGAFESREFVRSLGGDIKVESTPGEGSLFQIFIPCIRKEQNSGNPNKTILGKHH